jgi:hypothetical protein
MELVSSSAMVSSFDSTWCYFFIFFFFFSCGIAIIF